MYSIHLMCACGARGGQRKLQTLWNWSYRWLWAALWLLGKEPRFSGRAVRAPNCWTIITLAPHHFPNSTSYYGMYATTFSFPFFSFFCETGSQCILAGLELAMYMRLASNSKKFTSPYLPNAGIKHMCWGCEDCSAVKNIYCSCRGPDFGSQHPHSCSKPFVTPAPGGVLWPPLHLHSTKHISTYRYTTTHKKVK